MLLATCSCFISYGMEKFDFTNDYKLLILLGISPFATSKLSVHLPVMLSFTGTKNDIASHFGDHGFFVLNLKFSVLCLTPKSSNKVTEYFSP